jgi:hypothetical protein
MRVRVVLLSAAALAGVCSATPVHAQVYYYCKASASGRGGHIGSYYSGVINLPDDRGSSAGESAYQRMTSDFRTHIMSSTGANFAGLLCSSSSSRAETERLLERDYSDLARRDPRVVVRTGWTADYGGATEQRRTSPSGAGRSPGVYIMPPTLPGTQPADTIRTSDAERQAIAERYRQQEREIAERNAREAAAHQARIAEADRRNAAHQAVMAESARQQEAYRRARAQWEADTARCRAARACASPQ